MQDIAKYISVLKCELTNKQLAPGISFDEEEQRIWIYFEKEKLGPFNTKSLMAGSFWYLVSPYKTTEIADCFFNVNKRKFVKAWKNSYTGLLVMLTLTCFGLAATNPTVSVALAFLVFVFLVYWQAKNISLLFAYSFFRK